ncbi:STAS/SEC14 domain-containing protein [Pontibacterium granulatum]|uniref:STAS/SEC14 domain-containing protein n=1 Tax=Pontibacterium granulatum TaxID=2036029 RepID=UPI00249CCE07|nr:STAS/SEC14 domain-containing protein [Pontibacterium granulatum]MDI3324384.1 STAS/SEC14 domain-containing protein [Pontibacterium granulatum]
MLYNLPETAGDIIVVQATDTLTAKDYTETFIPLLEEKLATHEKVRVLLYLDHGFTGFEAAALWEDAKFGLAHRNDFLRLAVVGDADWMEWLAKIADLLAGGETRHFTSSQFLQALHWIDGNDEV